MACIGTAEKRNIVIIENKLLWILNVISSFPALGAVNDFL